MIRIGRCSDDMVSSRFQTYLSRKAAWMIVTSGEVKASVAASFLVGCSGSIRNVLLTSMAASTRHSPIALWLAIWTQAVSWALSSAQITSCTLVSGWSSDNEIPVLCSNESSLAGDTNWIR